MSQSQEKQNRQAAPDTAGPVGWRNWRAANENRESTGAFEYALYTDALVTGEPTTGPYQWLNTLAHELRSHLGKSAPAVVLRAEIHLTDQEYSPSDIDWDKTDTKDYLAGDLGDEIANLASLALQRRLQSGGMTRRFDAGDERGTPLEGWHDRPLLVEPRLDARSILPGIAEGVQLDDAVDLLERYPLLGLNDARALARAARLYGQALWVADDDPAQAWLRLVSALEAAANRTKVAKGLSNRDLVGEADPELLALIDKAPRDVGDDLAEKLAPTMKATNKFLEFTLSHLCDPPPKRPDFGEIEWSVEGLTPALRTIYGHRSLELHEGVPFPGPLCNPPMVDEKSTPTEKIHSFGIAGGGAVWTEEDLPMHLHTFAYIVGGALRKWWGELRTL